MLDRVNQRWQMGRAARYDFRAQCGEAFIELFRVLKVKLDEPLTKPWVGCSMTPFRLEDGRVTRKGGCEFVDALSPVIADDNGCLLGFKMGIGLLLNAPTDSTTPVRNLVIEVKLCSKHHGDDLWFHVPELIDSSAGSNKPIPVHLPLILPDEKKGPDVAKALNAVEVAWNAIQPCEKDEKSEVLRTLGNRLGEARRVLQQVALLPHGALRLLEAVERSCSEGISNEQQLEWNQSRLSALAKAATSGAQSNQAIEQTAMNLKLLIEQVLTDGKNCGIARNSPKIWYEYLPRKQRKS